MHGMGMNNYRIASYIALGIGVLSCLIYLEHHLEMQRISCLTSGNVAVYIKKRL